MKENKFKQIGGPKIDNIVDYIADYTKRKKHGTKYSNVQICLGCDSQAKRRSVNYAITIVLYDDFQHNGAHYVFKRIRVPKSYLRKRKRVSQWFIDKIEDFNDDIFMELDDLIINRLWNEVEYLMELGLWLDDELKGKYFINHAKNDYDGSQPYRLPIIHLDFNPFEGLKRENKSNKLYSSAMGMLSAMGFRVVGKPDAYASSSAADLVCK
jgi:predicted RNase H-related nuclease YkuK (DUF458 family)